MNELMNKRNQAIKSLQIFLSENLWFWKPSSYLTDFANGPKFMFHNSRPQQEDAKHGRPEPAEVHRVRPDGACTSSHSPLHSRLFFTRVMSFSIIKPSPFCTKLPSVLKCNLAGGELGIFSVQERLKRTNNW